MLSNGGDGCKWHKKHLHPVRTGKTAAMTLVPKKLGILRRRLIQLVLGEKHSKMATTNRQCYCIFHNTNYRQPSFPDATEIWNALPHNVVSASSVNSFWHQLQNFSQF